MKFNFNIRVLMEAAEVSKLYNRLGLQNLTRIT